MNKPVGQASIKQLIAENEALIQELRVSRKASSITAELVARQFANLDIVLKELDQKARNEKKLREEMAKSRKIAETASIAKSDFLANMSHEIRTPMNGILGMTELVLNTELSDDQRQYLDMVRQSAVRLLRVINDILDFSRVESGKMELDPTTFELHKSLYNSLKMFTLQADKKGIELLIQIAPNVPSQIYADSHRLLQILINLVNNAIKFTAKGTVLLEVTTTGKAIKNKHFIRFSVSDTGIGIPASKQKQIFESFSQADTTTTRQYGGTGLGLAISAQLASLFGSTIELSSTPGKGSAFWFDCVLPSSPEAVEDKTDLVSDHFPELCTPENLSRISILLAEDEQINQLLAIALLEQLGLNVTTVTNGQDAVDQVVNYSYDLIFMDLQMPGIDGFEATRQIRLLEGEKGEIPIVALTAHALQKDREKCRKAGMNDFLSKPIENEQLKQLLCKYLLPIVEKRRQKG